MCLVFVSYINMSRFALLLVFAVVCFYGAMGESNAFLSAGRTDNSGSPYPERAPAGVWDRSKVLREVTGPNHSDKADLCLFLKDSEIEGHISCRLRFSRSKFNRNPFGLRFGKREWSYLPYSKTAQSGMSKPPPNLLSIEERTT